MDFFKIKERSTKRGVLEVYPDFRVCRSKDLMVRGKSFYAIWDEEQGLWSTDEYDVQRLVDAELIKHKETAKARTDEIVQIKLMSDFSTNSWSAFRAYLNNISDNFHTLDENLTFANSDIKRKDYVSRRLLYPLEEGTHDAWDEIISTLYDAEEKEKIEWAIGAIVAGEAKKIQKFLVLYGDAGTGKSTILNIVQSLFDSYYTTFDAKALTTNNNAFSTEVFKNNPLVAIQHDGDLSKIEDNTKLNSIVSHEMMTMNEKYKPSYMARVNCFLFMATNKPVKITDSKSGIIRRLIDVRPTGKKIPTSRYHILMNQIDFELGAIAHHCQEVYKSMGKNYYSTYKPIDMMFKTDVFFNFVEDNYYIFKDSDGITLKQSYEMYKTYCQDTGLEYQLPRYKFREELKNYFSAFQDIVRIEGIQMRSYFSGFITDKFKSIPEKKETYNIPLFLEYTNSIFDNICKDCPAQYATEEEVPINKWENVKTKLSKIDTTKVHYVRVPENHIVIDFDLKDEDGNKDREKNIRAASTWPPTYTEFSKSGSGVHLHYYYDGDVSMLSRIYDDDIEIKVFTGKSSLRRKLTKCNNRPITTINSGLPLKGEKKMVNVDEVKSEQALRNLLKRNLNKEIHDSTKPSIDFIHKILEDAYASGLVYDLTDMRPAVLAFANNSSNQALTCLSIVNTMDFKSKDEIKDYENYKEDSLIFFDVEVFPNLFIVVWKKEGDDSEPVKMINPEPKEIEKLLNFKLVGFNCRRYDNHILYARYIGYSNLELYNLSQKIINGSRNAMFSQAYNLSYTDVYEFSSVKQSLKKWEIELGIHHQELGLPWDESVDESRWDEVADYCINDVVATEEVFNARKADFVARQILSELSGLSVNNTTQNHTAKIIFGDDPNPQDKFVYTDLSEIFPGYKYENGKSTYRGEIVGEGGYVYSEPGMYGNVALLDVASMHPNSLINLNAFGPYTENFEALVNARLAIKHKEYDKAKTMMGGKLKKYLGDASQANDLAYALKIIINIVYGMTSAKFNNKFKDPKNIDNIVAKRGALFMIDLKHAVQEQGYTVAHIKTDSIKIPDATGDIVKFITDFGAKYGYVFEHEATFDKLCLVNYAVYIAKNDGKWEATGAQFAQPYVYKTLFSKEPIDFKDMCETKTVTTALYLDLNEGLTTEEHKFHFVGKAGSFCPIKPGKGGGILLREKDGKYNAASGSKGYRWLEAEVVEQLKKEGDIDRNYYNKLVDDAVEKISQFGDFEWFISEDPYVTPKPPNDIPPWIMPCGDLKVETCYDCKMFNNKNKKCEKGYSLKDIILKGEKNGK